MKKNKAIIISILFLICSNLFSQNKLKNSQQLNQVKIGNQIWMTNNLDVTTFSNGDSIPEAKTVEEWTSSIRNNKPAWCYEENNPKTKIYNIYALKDKRGLAPKGWHIPTIYEWAQLVEFLGGKDKATQKLMSNSGWAEWIEEIPCKNCEKWAASYRYSVPCHACKNTRISKVNRYKGGTNSSGFNAFPNKYRELNTLAKTADFETYPKQKTMAAWWSSSTKIAWGPQHLLHREGCEEGRNIFEVYSTGERSLPGPISFSCANGSYPVRCIKNRPDEIVLSGITMDSSRTNEELVKGTFIRKCEIVFKYEAQKYGLFNDVVVKSVNMPELTLQLKSDTIRNRTGEVKGYLVGTPNSTGQAKFSFNLGGVTVKFSKNVTIGNPHSCGVPAVHNPMIYYGKVSDRDGNFYKTVRVGDYEWMAENLKTRHYNDGDALIEANNNEQWKELNDLKTGGYCTENPLPQDIGCIAGYFYNRYAIENPKNLCPIGWNVPTEREWKTLTEVGSYELDLFSQYPNFHELDILKSENEKGFSAIPAGNREEDGTFKGIGSYAHYWHKKPMLKPGESFDYQSEKKILFGKRGGEIYYDGYTENHFLDYNYGKNVRCVKFVGNASMKKLHCQKTTGNNIVLRKNFESRNNFIEIPYSDGNGGLQPAVKFSSAGVTGLWAELDSGFIQQGNSKLFLKIKGVPNDTGIANIKLKLGDQTCEFLFKVDKPAPMISSFDGDTIFRFTIQKDNINKKYIPDSLQIPYLNGNGMEYSFDELESIGSKLKYHPKLIPKKGILSNGSGKFTIKIGEFVDNIYKKPNYKSDEFGYNFYLFNTQQGFAECNIYLNIIEGNVDTFLIKKSNSDTIFLTNQPSYISKSINLEYKGGNGLSYSGRSIKSEGVKGLTLTVKENLLNQGDGNIIMDINGIPESEGQANFFFFLAGKEIYYSVYMKKAK